MIESIRTPGEVEYLKGKENFYFFAVDAEPALRYDRAFKRGSATDNVTFEKFMEDEKREMESTDPNKQNLSKCIELADFKFLNNGTMEELHAQVETALKSIE